MKTKVQKQQEAIERKRKNLPAIRQKWFEANVGGISYERTLAEFGQEEADKRCFQAYKKLQKAAAECQTDLHGNPL